VAQGAGVPPWRIVQLIGPSAGGLTEMTGIAAIDSSHAWAVGSECRSTTTCLFGLAVDQWNGHSWTAMSLPHSLGPGAQAYGTPSVGATSPQNVWVLTDTSAVTAYADHWTGTTWTSTALPGSVNVEATYVIGTSNVWAFGWGQGLVPYAREYNGSQWVAHPTPVVVTRPSMLSAVSAHDIWVVGSTPLSAGTRTTETAEWTGAGWRVIHLSNLHLAANTALDPDNISVFASASNNVWIYSGLQGFITNAGWVPIPGSVLAHWNGKAWTRVTVPYPVRQTGAFTSDGRGGLWLFASEQAPGTPTVFIHYNSGTWSRQAAPAPSGEYTWATALDRGPGTTSVWAVGFVARPSIYGGQGAILKYGT
jgi:hypothetical protein